jgi:hypothetical protein
LDAYVFGCLSCFYYPKLRDPSLSSLLKKHPILCKYCTEISRKYFSDYTDVLKLPSLEDTTVTIETLREEALLQRRENKKTWLFLGTSAFMLALPYLIRFVIARAANGNSEAVEEVEELEGGEYEDY